jgi:hypothetical protein
MKSEIYRQLYDFELAQRDHLIAAANIPILAITGLGSALVAMVVGFPYSKSVQTNLFVLGAAIAALFLIIAIISVFRSILGYQYARTTSPKKWQDYYDVLLQRHLGKPNQVQLADSTFERSFNRQLGEATDQNKANNLRRSHYVIRANLCLVLALGCLGLTGLDFVFVSANHREIVHEVRVVP